MIFKINKDIGCKSASIYMKGDNFMDNNGNIVDSVDTVCLMIGPYRNLTTWMASLLHFHPNCQSLEHTGRFVIPNNNLNFLNDYSLSRFNNFVKFALSASSNKRNIAEHWGGNILYTQPFNNYPYMKDIYFNRYGDKYIKDDVKCIIWKESGLTSAILGNLMSYPFLGDFSVSHIDFDFKYVFDNNSKLKFLFPIRNPIDCAISNADGNIGLHKQYLKSILLGIKWFFDTSPLYESYNRFYHFFQDDIKRDLFVELATFLGLQIDAKWLNDCVECCKIKKSYNYDKNLIDYYYQLVDLYFSDNNYVYNKLKNIISG